MTFAELRLALLEHAYFQARIASCSATQEPNVKLLDVIVSELGSTIIQLEERLAREKENANKYRS